MSQVARSDGAERFTDALAYWTTHLWHPPAEGVGGTEETVQSHALIGYVDGHRKPVYSEVLIPRGLIGRLGVILGCRALLLLHDEHGHPLFVTTHRGDQHLTVGVPAFLERYEQHAGNSQITRMIVDREGTATEFLVRLHAEGRHVVTILQTNQYRDLSSFADVGPFVPLSTDTHGQLVREVAPARISLPRDDHLDEPLCLQVALIRDLRRRVPVQPDPEEEQYPSRWDSDLPPEERTWWHDGWQATAAPAKETTAKLIPIVTTQETPAIDAKERKDEVDAFMEPLGRKEWQAYEQCNAEFRKQERYCQEQRVVLRALEDLKEQERTMYELDNRKDHTMTVFKVALANLAIWVRDRYFPASYAQATWKRLLLFFQLPGTITQDATLVQVKLRPFNDRELNRDLAVLCERVNQAAPCLPDGRRLFFTIRPSCCILAAQTAPKIL